MNFREKNLVPGEFLGERGIRTPDTVTGITDFESAAFNRSAISPVYVVAIYIAIFS